MGSLGIPAIVHHLYDFGNLPVFIAFGCKYRRNEIASDGTVLKRKYVDMSFNLDERICDGFYYASALKYLRRVLADPHRLDTPPEAGGKRYRLTDGPGSDALPGHLAAYISFGHNPNVVGDAQVRF